MYFIPVSHILLQEEKAEKKKTRGYAPVLPAGSMFKLAPLPLSPLSISQPIGTAAPPSAMVSQLKQLQ